MPNGHGLKEYGGHKYADHDGTSDCKFGCECWMGPSRSGGPAGLDPFGTCPKNPKDGNFLGGVADYEYVVNARIADLQSRLRAAEDLLMRVNPDQIRLAEDLAKIRGELAQQESLLHQIRRLLGE